MWGHGDVEVFQLVDGGMWMAPFIPMVFVGVNSVQVGAIFRCIWF